MAMTRTVPAAALTSNANVLRAWPGTAASGWVTVRRSTPSGASPVPCGAGAVANADANASAPPFGTSPGPGSTYVGTPAPWVSSR